MTKRSKTRGVMATHLLLDLELIHDGRQLRQNLVCLLVVFELRGDEVREVAERLGGVENLGPPCQMMGAGSGMRI